ncbi:caspase recruitment domain-containing protein 9 isoform X6 [Silurus asotus]|uniref:Caspase recruitment domain-containing protein 9 isoform X6 n=1 Tax=Silurus asotus TaxID=30991 RepID=A0AAD5FDV2_SILAS|nr:caspase recruitment domain-containing protein 9 isoform X6 [Silurus asotus]
MAFSEDLLAERNKLQNEILALESNLDDGNNLADLLSSDRDNDEESDDSGHAGEVVAHNDLEAERNKIQREIEELERTLGADAALVDALTDSEHGSLVDSKELEEQLSGPSYVYSGLPHLKLFLGSFMKPYFKDKLTGLFEGLRQPDDLMRFWQNYLHPSINKSTWSQDEIAKLADAAEEHKYCHWEQIAESLGTGRTAFMCFQTYQRYISKRFRKREWNKEEDQVFLELIEKMRIGNFIPYTQTFQNALDKGAAYDLLEGLYLTVGRGVSEDLQGEAMARVKFLADLLSIYLDCLQANIKRGAWSEEEVELLKKLVEKHGVGKWSKIAAEIPNRVDSQCLNKWKWMMQKANKQGVKRAIGKKRSEKYEPQSKKRCTRQQKLSSAKDDDFHTESESSEDEKEQVPYMDSDSEQAGEAEISSDENCKLEYVQPVMKEWIPACENNLVHSSGKVKTILVRLPTEPEECARGSVRNTVLDRLGKPVKTYVGMEPPALEKCSNLSSEHALIMVSECEVRRFLICMKSSVMNSRTLKSKDSLSSCAKQKDTRKDGEKADIVGKRAANVPLVKTPVFLLFLQTPGPKSRPYSATKPTLGSSRCVKTVADLLAEKKAQREKQSGPLRIPGLLGPQLLPQPAKIPIPPQSNQRGKTKRSASQQIDAALILPQTFIVTRPNTDNIAGTTHNVIQGISPVLQMGTEDASKIPQPVLHLEIPVESGMETHKAFCPTTTLSTPGPPTKASKEVGSEKRKHKPTMKAQALMADAKTKLSKKQAVKKKENSSVNQTVALLPQTSAWILTPAGLMPVAENQIQAPGIPGHENQVIPNKAQMLFQPPVTINQVPNIVGVPQDLSNTNVPTSITLSADQSSKTGNPKSSLVPVSSSPVGTSQNLTASCNADATNKVLKVSVTNTSTITSAYPMNITDPGTNSGPQTQKTPHPVAQPVFQQPIIINQNGFLALINTAGPCQPNAPNASSAATINVTGAPTTSTSCNINKSLPMCFNIPISPVTTSHQIMPQTMQQKTAHHTKTQIVQKAATVSTPRPKQTTFEPSLVFFEQPAQVKNWMNGNGGISLPGLENKMPYLPPFVSSINTLTNLLKGKDSLLKSAVQILPEEHRDNSDEDAKIAAVRKMVSERLKTNQAYLLLKARFLSCFTLPALLATINPRVQSADAPDLEDGIDKVKPKQFGDDQFSPMTHIVCSLGVLLDILQRTGYKGYVAFLESLELDYPQLYLKITGKEPSRVFSILLGESGLTQFLMNEVTRLQKELHEERKARLAASAQMAEHAETIRRLQTRECEVRKQQERVQRMREERDQMWDKARLLKDENYKLMSNMNRLSEEKNCALMCNRDLQLEIERLKHSLMNAESDSKLQRKRTITLKNAMEQRPSQEMVLELQKENDLLRAQMQELQSSSQAQIVKEDIEKPSNESMEDLKEQRKAHQELVNKFYELRRELHDAEELRDKAILSREEYHQENCKNLQDKDNYRKQLREMGERYDELQVQLFRTQGEILALQAKLRKQKHYHKTIRVSSHVICRTLLLYDIMCFD